MTRPGRKSPDPQDAPEPAVVCWSCQQELQPLDMVRVDDQRIHVCGECWFEIHVAERVKLAQAFRDRSVGGVIDSLRRIVDAAIQGRFTEGVGRDFSVDDLSDADDFEDEDGEGWKRG